MPNNDAQFVGDIIQILSEEVGETADLARSNASFSTQIPGAIEVTMVTQQGNLYEISIIVDLNKAPQAAAFEYGSGIHSTKGPQEKYPIEPKNKKALAFEWNPDFEPWGSPKFIGKTPDGRYLFRKVMHPGIQARPYLEPAVDAKLPELKARLTTVLKEYTLAVARDVV